MTYQEIISKVAAELQLPTRLVDKTYRAYWRSVREHVSALPLKEDLTEEEFSKLQPNVNIPSIGKLNVTFDRYRKMKKMYNIKQQIIQSKNATRKEN